MDLECYATIAGLMLTIIVLIFTVKTYLHAKVDEIRGSLESIGETSLSHNLKVKPALEDDGFLHIGVGPTMDVLSPPNWIMAGANWGYIKYAWRLGSTIRTRRGLRIILPHCCRHRFTTWLLRNGIPREYVKELRGTRREAIDISTT